MNDERTLEELLEAGEVEAGLILRGEWTDAERRIAAEAWSAGIKAGKRAATRADALSVGAPDALVASLTAARQERDGAEQQGWVTASLMLELERAMATARRERDNAYDDGYDAGAERARGEVVCSVCGWNHDRDESAACDGCEAVRFDELPRLLAAARQREQQLTQALTEIATADHWNPPRPGAEQVVLWMLQTARASLAAAVLAGEAPPTAQPPPFHSLLDEDDLAVMAEDALESVRQEQPDAPAERQA